MNKILLFTIFLLSQYALSQDALTCKDGGRIFDINKQKIAPTTMREFLKDTPEALKLYNAGRSKKTVGNIFFWTGISTILIKLNSVLNKIKQQSYNQTAETNNIMYFVGAGIFLVSIPIKIGFERKIKKAINIANTDTGQTTLNYNSEIIANSNGIGFKITF